MGLFDKIRGSDDEVEIRPRNQDSYDFGDTADDDDSSDEFILPGMDSAGSTKDTPGRDETRDRRQGRDDGVDRLIEQNERIIELLEELTGTDDDSTADVESVL